MSGSEGLVEALPPLHRLALAYAPARAREQTLALLALDARLAGIVRNSHEPMLAQLRLSWWREQLKAEADSWPSGEPLLAVFKSWGGRHRALTSLADGWEMLTGAAPLEASAFDTFADGRGEAFAALAGVVGARDDVQVVRQMGRAWALADLAAKVAHPAEQKTATLLAQAAPGLRLSRAMRPLTVLHGLAQRRLDGLSPASLLAAMRLGLLGR
jgi:15-cis-phytoene synthase